MGISRILSFDGGPASITYVRTLREIVTWYPEFLLRGELFAGTSGGALTAAFLARHVHPGMSAADARTLIDRLIAVNGELMDLLTPDEAGYQRLLLGTGAMVSFDAVRRFLARDDVLGATTTLGDLAQPVVLVAARSVRPWKPHVHTNFGPSAEPATLVTDAVLRSAAFPMLLPGWQGHADGAMFANNPAIVALAYATEALDVSPEVMILTMGSDDGSSALSNLRTPHDAFDQPGAAPGLAGKVEELASEALSAASGALHGASDALHRAAALFGGGDGGGDDDDPAHIGHLFERGLAQGAMPALEAAFASDDAKLQAAAEQIAHAARHTTALERAVAAAVEDKIGRMRQPGAGHREGADDWGWRAWMTYVWNPLYALQVLLNSQGRGAVDVIERLIGKERVLRVAPVALASSNVMLLAMILNMAPQARDAARLAAWLWSDPITNALLQFDTSHAEVKAFAERWLQAELTPASR